MCSCKTPLPIANFLDKTQIVYLMTLVCVCTHTHTHTHTHVIFARIIWKNIFQQVVLLTILKQQVSC